MQDPESIRRFTRGVALMRDPPWLPIAAWLAVVPMLGQLGVIGTPWGACLLLLAVAGTALASHRFKRTYGVVKVAPAAPLGAWPGCLTVSLLAVAIIGLNVLATVVRLPVALGLTAFGAWLAWGARASKGIRPQLYFFAAIMLVLSFGPLIGNLAGYRTLPNSLLTAIFTTSYGIGWAYVCIQDYRMLRRALRHAQG
jgi:hypothetical protein